jgi:hypothetical protein
LKYSKLYAFDYHNKPGGKIDGGCGGIWARKADWKQLLESLLLKQSLMKLVKNVVSYSDKVLFDKISLDSGKLPNDFLETLSQTKLARTQVDFQLPIQLEF